MQTLILRWVSMEDCLYHNLDDIECFEMGMDEKKGHMTKKMENKKEQHNTIQIRNKIKNILIVHDVSD